jgi:predicted TIM-barrel enzyme
MSGEGERPAAVFRPKPHAIEAIFGRRKAVIGVIHLRALPGAPEYRGETMQDLVDFALEEAARYAAGGVDGLIVENHGDIPFAKPDRIGPETVASMATRYRAWLHGRDVKIFADVHVKHGAHAMTADRSIQELARDNEFFDADVAIATGQRTGDAATTEELQAIAGGTALPVVVGSGVRPDNVGDILRIADGVIVASALKQDGVWWNPVDPDRLRVFMCCVKMARG